MPSPQKGYKLALPRQDTTACPDMCGHLSQRLRTPRLSQRPGPPACPFPCHPRAAASSVAWPAPPTSWRWAHRRTCTRQHIVEVRCCKSQLRVMPMHLMLHRAMRQVDTLVRHMQSNRHVHWQNCATYTVQHTGRLTHVISPQLRADHSESKQQVPLVELRPACLCSKCQAA